MAVRVISFGQSAVAKIKNVVKANGRTEHNRRSTGLGVNDVIIYPERICCLFSVVAGWIRNATRNRGMQNIMRLLLTKVSNCLIVREYVPTLN